MFFATSVCAVRLCCSLCLARRRTSNSAKWGHHLVRGVANIKWSV